MEILIDNRQTRISIDTQALTKKAQQILEGLGCEASTMLSILLVSTDEMAELNFRYRNKVGATNVLSFSQLEGEHAPNRHLLGDVVICGERAADDAMELGYTEEEMVTFLLCHGILHLVGYNHSEDKEATAMEDEVKRLFSLFFPET
jgi:probable rRNA maturation factor